MQHLDIKIYSTFIATIIISFILALNYVYPNFENFTITVFGYSIYVFLLFIVGALVSFVVDSRAKNKIIKFVGYFLSGSLIITVFYSIDTQEIIIKGIFPIITIGGICAIVFFLIQETLIYIRSR